MFLIIEFESHAFLEDVATNIFPIKNKDLYTRQAYQLLLRT